MLCNVKWEHTLRGLLSVQILAERQIWKWRHDGTRAEEKEERTEEKEKSGNKNKGCERNKKQERKRRKIGKGTWVVQVEKE